MTASANRCVIVFARQLIAGAVKTRLIPQLGATRALQLYRVLLEKALLAASDTPVASRQLWADTLHYSATLHGTASVQEDRAAQPSLSQLGARYGMSLHGQCGEDLGQRMLHAFADALRDHRQVVLIGSDCPQYTADYLEAAFAALEHYPAVVGPAFDGGYVLLGLTALDPMLFTDIRWSSDSVLTQTERRLCRLGFDWQRLEPLRDIDEVDDLQYFPALSGNFARQVESNSLQALT